MTILEVARKITDEDRENAYKQGDICFYSIADLWSAYLGIELQGKDVAMMMILMKIARERMGHKADNLVDIAGYARCLSRMNGDERDGAS